MSDTIEAIIRRIVREELQAVLSGRQLSQHAEDSVTESPAPVTTTGWVTVDELKIWDGIGPVIIHAGDRCKVRGLGRRMKNPDTGVLEASTADNCTIVAMQKRGDVTNVEVRKHTGTKHVVKSDRIIPKRPKRGK